MKRWVLVGAALVAGFGVLLVGLVALFRIIVDERADAERQVDEQLASATRAAESDLQADVEAALRTGEAAVPKALADPLLASTQLLFVKGGEVILPRRNRSAGRATRVAEVSKRVRNASDPLAGDDPSVERMRLVRALGDAANVTNAERAWLDHRVFFKLPVDIEVATTLVALETLDARRALDAARAEAFFRTGRNHEQERIPGFLPVVLAASLDADDRKLVAERATALARRYLVRVDDFEARLRDQDGVPVIAPPMVPAGAVARSPDGAWWYRRADTDELVGAALDPNALTALTERYRASGRIGAADVFAPGSGDGVRLTLSAPSCLERLSEIGRRFYLKAAALGGVAVLAAAVFFLALLLQRRRAAYIELRSHLLAAVTHELKTPLASIRALAETLERRLGADPQARDYPERIVRSTERLGFLVDNVLSFTRLERGAWTPRMSPVTIADLVAWLRQEVVPRAPRPIDLEVAIEPAGLAVSADPDLARLLLSNLVENAAKYAIKDRVAVAITARCVGADVVLVVKDDGPGLGVARPERLFRDFERGHVSAVKGTGLGLSICRRVMMLHGGTLRVAATGPSGTVFEAVFRNGARDESY